MREARHYLSGLVNLASVEDPADQRALFRQSFATLAAQVENHRRSVPLEGFDPDALEASARAALKAGLLDDLGWLSDSSAAVALYELAAALPVGTVKRELGRRVLRWLRGGNAATFVALATQLALGSKHALDGRRLRARVALALDLPLGAGVRADGLALALISRRDLSREWLTLPSTGSLPARRLAARLLERAAREAAQRAAEGDDSGLRVFSTLSVKNAYARLLADRESLVWRHVAVARGLLCLAMPEMDREIHTHLKPSGGITEWRRAAASLAASIAVRPQGARQACEQLLESEVFAQDRGVAAAMVLGLPRAADAEPAAVTELLEALVRRGGIDAIEALVDLRREGVGAEVAAWAARLASARLREELGQERGGDDGKVALMQCLADELQDADERKVRTLREELLIALTRFVDEGPEAAYESAVEVIEEALKRVDLLESVTHDEEHGRQYAFRALRELDLAVLETDTLESLLALGGDERDQRLGDLFQRLTQWLVLYEGDPIEEPGEVEHFTLRLRRLRTLLHLVDADGPNVEERSELLRSRRLLTARVLYNRASKDARTPLRRALCAAASRAGDALVREDLAEVSDVVLSVGAHLDAQVDLTTMAEASMVPEIDAALCAYARLAEVTANAEPSGGGLRLALDGLLDLANELPIASSPRVEALRSGLLDFARALENVACSGSLAELSERAGETPLDTFASAIHALAQLVLGARRRLGERMRDEETESPAAVRYLEVCLERARSGSREALDDAVEAAKVAVARDLPHAISNVAALTFERLRDLPDDAPRRTYTSFLPAPPKEAPLPPWMPPSRTLGGFRVLRAIGSGAVGSVFVAERAEERDAFGAERVALKVPDYSGAAARTLSEEEFLDLFRQEAGALLAVPRDAHLASFITFDAGARPKPILVMELIEGPTLERFLEKGGLKMSAALDILLGIASGLEAMHGVGVAHLDVKPSNVIMRANGGDPHTLPVLVDFGLAGRHLRPGCGTGEYGAPEIWGLSDRSQGEAEAAPADVYAFGCVCYEILTTQTLFSAPSELGLITSHVSHDGMPPRVGALTTDPRTAGLAEVLRRCLRRDGRERATMPEVRHALDHIAPTLETLQWPLQV